MHIIHFEGYHAKKNINGESTYKKRGWILGDSYDPNWFVNGTDRHM